MPYYSINLVARCTAVVWADGEEEAMDVAYQNCYSGDYEHADTESDGVISEDQIDSSKRHADKVIE